MAKLQKEKEIEMFHLLVRSCDVYSGQALSQAKVKSQKFCLGLHIGNRFIILGPVSAAFPRPLAGSQMGNRAVKK